MPCAGQPVLPPGPDDTFATYTIEAAPVLLPVLVAVVALVATPAFRRRAGLTARRAVLWSAVTGYALMVVAVTLFPIAVHPAGHRPGQWWAMIQPVPFRVEAVSFLLNVVMTVPLGVLLPVLSPRLRTLGRIAACGLCTSVAIESAQLLLGVLVGSRRTVDVNDLIANTAGAVIGWWLLRRATRT